jgi:hypothetical protein
VPFSRQRVLPAVRRAPFAAVGPTRFCSSASMDSCRRIVAQGNPFYAVSAVSLARRIQLTLHGTTDAGNRSGARSCHPCVCSDRCSISRIRHSSARGSYSSDARICCCRARRTSSRDSTLSASARASSGVRFDEAHS